MVSHCEKKLPQMGVCAFNWCVEPIAKCYLKAIMNNAVKQGIFVWKMRIERGPVDGRSIGDVLYRDVVEALFLLNIQKGVD
jgi:hypothetical protein